MTVDKTESEAEATVLEAKAGLPSEVVTEEKELEASQREVPQPPVTEEKDESVEPGVQSHETFVSEEKTDIQTQQPETIVAFVEPMATEDLSTESSNVPVTIEPAEELVTEPPYDGIQEVGVMKLSFRRLVLKIISTGDSCIYLCRPTRG